MTRHSFLFKGGNELTTMGATWFVSYSYYLYINHTHLNWKKVKTFNNRISTYNRTSNYHKFWLNKILQMDEYNLGKNTLGLSGSQIKKMAGELLKILP